MVVLAICGVGHRCAGTSSTPMMILPPAPTPPTAATTPSQAVTGSAAAGFKTGRSSSLPPGRRVTVLRPAGYLPPSCCSSPSTHPPPIASASVKPCRQGKSAG